MPDQDLPDENGETTITINPSQRNSKTIAEKSTFSSRVVAANSVQAEEVPTIPLGSLQTVNALQPEVAVRSVASTYLPRLPAPLVVQPSEYRRSVKEWIQVWWDGIRPAYLSLALMPVLVGSTLAWTQTINTKNPFGAFHILHFVAVVLAVIMMQIGANLINDYYDYLKGIDTSNPLGPGGLIQQGLIRPTRILIIGLALLVVGTIIGASVAWSGGIFPYLFGLIGILCAYFYSGTSRALTAMTLGELASFCIFGPLLTLGAYMVEFPLPDRVSLLTVLLYSLPLGLLATAVVHSNNMRDVESDAQAKKRTIAGLIGLRWSRLFYLLLVLGAYIIVAALGIPHHAPHFILLTFWTLPILVVALTGIFRADLPPALHLVMTETIKLATYFTLLLIVGLILSAFAGVLPQIPTHLLPF